MSEYRCPSEIAALFDDPKTEAEGMQKAVIWLADLGMKIGDKVWSPRVGWQEKTEELQS